MDYTYRSTRLRAQRYCFKSLGWVIVKGLLIGLLWACDATVSSDLEWVQADNLRLTKTIQNHLNHRDWQAVEKLCAETVRYRGRATHYAEVDEAKAQFVAHYRTTLTRERPGALEIRQLYPAGKYHVIAEGITVGEPPDPPVPVCLIYTIEHNHITRLYAY